MTCIQQLKPNSIKVSFPASQSAVTDVSIITVSSRVGKTVYKPVSVVLISSVVIVDMNDSHCNAEAERRSRDVGRSPRRTFSLYI